MNQVKEPEPKKKRKHTWIFWTLGSIVAFIVLVTVIGAMSGGTNTNTASANKNTNQVYSVNQDVRVGDVRWKLLSARDRGSVLKAADSRYKTIATDKTTPGHYVEITMEVENVGSDMKTVTDVKLIDSKGREFTSSSDTSEWIPDGKDLFILSNLNPNVPQQFTAIYAVPTDASGLKVKVGDLNIFTSKEATINLGI